MSRPFARPRRQHALAAAVLLSGSLAGALEGSTPAEIAKATTAWRSDTARLGESLREAEAFRRRLLQGDAAEVGHALETFRRSAKTPAGRPDLSRFTVTANGFVEQVSGETRIDPQSAFAPFAGRWYGEWDGKPVDHDWSVVAAAPSLTATARSLGLRPEVVCQSAWIGDGFGWNLAARPAGAIGTVLLGHVYHVRDHDPRAIRTQFPLVAYAEGVGRLIWVTPSHVFFEEVIPGEDPGEERYAITGFSYRRIEGSIEPAETPFQAVYTRRPDDRPAWIRFAAP